MSTISLTKRNQMPERSHCLLSKGAAAEVSATSKSKPKLTTLTFLYEAISSQSTNILLLQYGIVMCINSIDLKALMTWRFGWCTYSRTW